MNLIDYIDFDEGRDFPEVEEPVCDGCGDRTRSLTWQDEWKFFACPKCSEDCERQLAQEAIRAIYCEHLNIRIEDHDLDGDGVRIFEEITCRDCGAELIERRGELVARRAA